MGNEFLFKSVGSLRKCRDRKKNDLEKELQYAVRVDSIVSAKVLCDTELKSGEEVEICLEGESIGVFRERNRIAFIPHMSPLLIERIRRTGGRAVGRLDRYLKHSNLMDISVDETLHGGSDDRQRAKTTSL